MGLCKLRSAGRMHKSCGPEVCQRCRGKGWHILAGDGSSSWVWSLCKWSLEWGLLHGVRGCCAAESIPAQIPGCNIPDLGFGQLTQYRQRVGVAGQAVWGAVAASLVCSPQSPGGFAASPEPWRELQVERAAKRDAEARSQGVLPQLCEQDSSEVVRSSSCCWSQAGPSEGSLHPLVTSEVSKDKPWAGMAPRRLWLTSHLAASASPSPVASAPRARAFLGFLRGSDLITCTVRPG